MEQSKFKVCYVITERGEKTFWNRIGVAFTNKDGSFVLEDGIVYHTYSAFERGVDGVWGMYQWLDRAPKGRNEAGVWWRRHDEYDKR